MTEDKNNTSDKNNKPDNGGEYCHGTGALRVGAYAAAGSVVGGPVGGALGGAIGVVHEYNKMNDCKKKPES